MTARGDASLLARIAQLPEPYRRTLRALHEGESKFVWSSDGRHELYDLAGDPWEEKNQLDQPRFAQDVVALRRELDAWHEEQDGRANRRR